MSPHPTPDDRKGRAVPWALALVAFVVFASGWAWMASWSNAPGRAHAAPPRWPAGAVRERPEAELELLVFLHPRCPCSLATLAELERIAARCGSRASITAWFVEPDGAPPGWLDGPVHDKASAIRDVVVRTDRGGAEARRFGALTSGTVCLYDRAGTLLFSGGITPARGHEGDSRGKDAILSVLAGGASGIADAPVYGCPLFDEEAAR